uniref:ankyrin repeat and BTB/POZ domain-containing protein 2-like n=1 Tax=Myxine glutinosa TaxID=7769 RepID=UPI00358F767E
MFSCCSEEEIRGAVTLVLSPGLVKQCLAAISRALSLFLMSTGEQPRRDKTSRCGLLALSPGRFFRWMQDSIPGCRLTERAAVALAACMEVLLAELQKQGEPRGTGPIWPLIQPYEYLITEQGLHGEPVLPDDRMALGENGRSKGKLKDGDQNGAGELAEYRSVQQACLTTCVGSKAELGALLAQVSRLVAQIMPGSSGRMCDHPTWRPEALHSLYHNLYCARAHVLQPPVVSLTQEIPLALRPPLWRWVWIAVCHATCRRAASVEAGDVAQASRLLLPGHSCPPARLEYERNGPILMAVACCDPSAEVVTKSFLKSAAFAMLDCGRVDVLGPAATLLGAEGVNVRNEQGLTPLMFASCHGDEAMVQMLLDLRAEPDVQVPSPSSTCPLVHPQTRHYTVLMFATAHGHVSVCQLLLEAGANPEGSLLDPLDENCSETPLQIAAAAGDLPMVKLLLSFGADPLVGTVWGGLGGPAGQRGEGSAISQAAAHGHRQVLHLLLSAPSPSCSPNLLSLAEILAEGLTEAEREKEETRGDVVEHRLRRGRVKGREKEREHVLEEAMYLAAEHGYADIVCYLRELGVPCPLPVWMTALHATWTTHCRPLALKLLNDFPMVISQELVEMTPHLTSLIHLLHACLKYNDQEAATRIAITISHCYAAQTRSKPTTERTAARGRLHASFVNSPNLSDVIFLVQGRPFHAHRVLLASSSPRFRAMLANADHDHAIRSVEIPDMSYRTFQTMMEELYRGDTEEALKIPDHELMELLTAAKHYELASLYHRFQEDCSRRLNASTCVSVYHFAKDIEAEFLVECCESFFLHHLPELITSSQFLELFHGPEELLLNTAEEVDDLEDTWQAEWPGVDEEEMMENEERDGKMEEAERELCVDMEDIHCDLTNGHQQFFLMHSLQKRFVSNLQHH